MCGREQLRDVRITLDAHGSSLGRINAGKQHHPVALCLFTVQEKHIAGYSKLFPQPFFQAAVQQITAPAEVFFRSAAFPRFDDKDQCAAGLYRGFHIVDGLRSLIEGHIPRKTAAACNDNVGFFLHGHLVHPLHLTAGRFPGGAVMAGADGTELFIGVHDQIHHKQIFHHARRFQHIQVQGVVL